MQSRAQRAYHQDPKYREERVAQGPHQTRGSSRLCRGRGLQGRLGCCKTSQQRKACSSHASQLRSQGQYPSDVRRPNQGQSHTYYVMVLEGLPLSQRLHEYKVSGQVIHVLELALNASLAPNSQYTRRHSCEHRRCRIIDDFQTFL